ncbi:MAG: diacylglycerol kinase family lipid kinase, partial [Candidatus Marinimicrobia bacterium]|nr:diacylglycerol kinase family lipid kinase [Candidatus Neomarinimicrobiota bacterium]
MSIKLIINPKAGKGSAFKKSQSVIAELKKRNVDFDYELTNAPREAVGIAREASGKFEKIVAVGGDGTINEVGEGLVESDSIFCVIPLGSGNDFANELKIPSKVNAAVDLLLKGSVRTIDVIKVNDRISLNTAGVGFNALVSDSVTQIKYLRGLSVYIWGVVKSAVRYEAIPMKIVINDKVIE